MEERQAVAFAASLEIAVSEAGAKTPDTALRCGVSHRETPRNNIMTVTLVGSVLYGLD